jgi:hypothetical protein
VFIPLKTESGKYVPAQTFFMNTPEADLKVVQFEQVEEDESTSTKPPREYTRTV